MGAVGSIPASEVDKGRKFLDHYGIDVSNLSDEDVVVKVNKINHHKKTRAQVLTRGRTVDTLSRLLAFVPEGFVGEFKSENDADIKLCESLGWKVFFDAKAKMESSTGTSDGRIRLGDQILMIIPEEEHVALKMIKEEARLVRRKKRNPKAQAEQETKGFACPVFPMGSLPTGDEVEGDDFLEED